MIRPIVKDVLFLEQKSEPATKEDKSIVTDLIDTLKANLDSCVGLAANMIGFKKTILVFAVGGNRERKSIPTQPYIAFHRM